MMQIKNFIERFRDEEDGAIMSIGLLFAVPILVWALLSTFVYLDLFRTELMSSKAAITVADMISREESTPITDEYIKGAWNLLSLLSETDEAPDLRVSVIWFDEDNDTLEVSWSKVEGTGGSYSGGLSKAAINNNDHRIPNMSDGERMIIVETLTKYEQPISYSMGPFTGADLNDVEFSNFTFVKPRFGLSSFCFDDEPTIQGNVLDC